MKIVFNRDKAKRITQKLAEKENMVEVRVKFKRFLGLNYWIITNK